MKAKDRRKENQKGCCAGCGKSTKPLDSYPINSVKVRPINPAYQNEETVIEYRSDDYLHRQNGPESPPSSVCLWQYASRAVSTKIPNTKDYKNGAVISINDEHQLELKR